MVGFDVGRIWGGLLKKNWVRNGEIRHFLGRTRE